jgi:predicted alpha/beta hydrolase
VADAGCRSVIREEKLRVRAADGAEADLHLVLPAGRTDRLLYWLPALGVAARNYAPFAQSLAQRGIAVALHEWRGAGSSNRRASRRVDWGYRELLLADLPAGLAAVRIRCGDARLMLGGHSLGGQFAALFAGLQQDAFERLLLVASGSPWWRCFHRPRLVQAACLAVPVIAHACGWFPGRRLGFGGNEARGVMTDWARSGRSGRYEVEGVGQDLEALLGEVDLPVHAWRFADDWLGPAASLDWLLAKLPKASRQVTVADAATLGAKADHFSWMRSPGQLAALLENSLRPSISTI